MIPNVIDVSKWQGEMDWAKAYARLKDLNPNRQVMAIMRAGSINDVTGECYTDFQFDRNQMIAPQYFLNLGVYWYFRANHDPLVQADYFIDLIERAIGGDSSDWQLGEDKWGNYILHEGHRWRIYPDHEAWGSLSPREAADRIELFWDRIENELFAKITGPYTRQSTWDPHVEARPRWGQYKLFVARYYEDLGHPWGDGKYKPRDWGDYSLWQYSADGNFRGREFGADADHIDLSYAQYEPDPLPEEPQEPGEPGMTDQLLTEIRDAVKDNTAAIRNMEFELTVMLQKVVKAIQGQDPGGPAPEPSWKKVQVKHTEKRINAWYIDDYNVKDKPILVMYPYENAPVKDRVQFQGGANAQVLDVDPDKLDANEVNGDSGFWKLAPHMYPAGLPELYVQEFEVVEI